MTSTASPLCFGAAATPAFRVGSGNAVLVAATVGAHHHHHLWEAGHVVSDAV